MIVSQVGSGASEDVARRPAARDAGQASKPSARPMPFTSTTGRACRIEPFLDQGGAFGPAGAPRPGSALGRSPGRASHMVRCADT